MLQWLVLGGAALAMLTAFGWALTRPPVVQLSEEAQAIVLIESRVAATQARPEDPAAWAALGQTRFAMGDFSGAASAYRRATRLNARDGASWSALGEAEVRASGGDAMPRPALDAFRRAVALDRTDPRARYYLGVERDLSGDHRGALEDWFALLADSPPDAPWVAPLRAAIARVGERHGINVAARLASVAAASASSGSRGVPPEVAQMIARLETGLAANPRDVAGWQLLMRSRMVLNQPALAQRALAQALAANPAQADALRDAADALGVPAP